MITKRKPLGNIAIKYIFSFILSLLLLQIPTSYRISNGVDLNISTAKLGPFVWISLLQYLSSSVSIASAEILNFGQGALPNCAYDCTQLYAAQFDCGGEDVQCFCLSPHVKDLLDGAGGWACNEACSEADRGAVEDWFGKTCMEYMSGDQPEDEDKDGKPEDKPTTKDQDINVKPTDIDESSPAASQASRAVEWWRKNWYWFLIAFLLITIPIASYALFFPIRKWYRQQRIARRERRPLPPLSLVSPHPPSGALYAEGGLNSPGLPVDYALPPPVPEGVFSDHARYADPYSPTLTRRNFFPGTGSERGGRYSSSAAMSMSMSDEEVIEAAAGVGAVRQESWERRVREEYEGRKSIWDKMAFWKGGKKVGSEVVEKGHHGPPPVLPAHIPASPIPGPSLLSTSSSFITPHRTPPLLDSSPQPGLPSPRRTPPFPLV